MRAALVRGQAGTFASPQRLTVAASVHQVTSPLAPTLSLTLSLTPTLTLGHLASRSNPKPNPKPNPNPNPRSPRLSRRRSGSDRPASCRRLAERLVGTFAPTRPTDTLHRTAACRRSSTRRTGGGSSCSGRWSSRTRHSSAGGEGREGGGARGEEGGAGSRPRRLPAGRACRSTRAEGLTSCPARQATTRAGARASSTSLAPR